MPHLYVYNLNRIVFNLFVYYISKIDMFLLESNAFEEKSIPKVFDFK